MIKILTIEREYGCGAPTIAQTLAERLHWRLWDREITCEIARRMKCDVTAVEQREERPDPVFHGLVKAFMRGSYEESMTGAKVELLDAETLARLFEDVIKDVAERGNCIIVGRGSPWFLRERPDAMHVFLYAPPDEKLRRVMAAGERESEATRLIENVDRERSAFIRKYYGHSWPLRELYHLMINSKIGDELVVKAILHHMELLNSQQ